jgi:fumarate reductase subunit C
MNRNPYVRPVSTTRWYWHHPRYLRYMSREVTCIFIGAFAVFMVCLLERLSRGQAAYESFLAAITGPWSVLAFLLVLVFAVHNTTSWFNVTPKAMPYLAWVLVSLAILYFAGVW